MIFLCRCQSSPSTYITSINIQHFIRDQGSYSEDVRAKDFQHFYILRSATRVGNFVAVAIIRTVNTDWFDEVSSAG